MPEVGLRQCRVLVVEDDEDALSACMAMVTSLGYVCCGTSQAVDAMQLIAADSDIGIVVTDLVLPTASGLMLLEELAFRFAGRRKLVGIVVTGFSSLNVAVQAMRADAVDFLTKPICLDELASALQRAYARWANGEMPGGASTQVDLVNRAPEWPGPGGAVAAMPSRGDLHKLARWLIRSRQKRAEFLAIDLLPDLAWDILLDLTMAALEGKPVMVSSVSAATQAPLSTALRHVRLLTEARLVRSWRDPDDRRRTMLELEPMTFEAMKSYLVDLYGR